MKIYYDEKRIETAKKILNNYHMITEQVKEIESLLDEHNETVGFIRRKSPLEGGGGSDTRIYKSKVENEVIRLDTLKYILGFKRSLILDIDYALKALSEVERRVIKCTYFNGYRLRDIVGHVGLPAHKVKTIERNAIGKLSVILDMDSFRLNLAFKSITGL